jgi:SAM-dependent methyltransferase
VTAVDVSATALQAGEAAAARAGVAQRIRWERHDLATSFPTGRFDLVTSAFLHSPVDFPREAVLRAAAEAVAVGGTLLIVGHVPSAAHPHVDLPSTEAVVAGLALPPAAWRQEVAQERTRQHAFADEEPTERVDSVVRFTRLA